MKKLRYPLLEINHDNIKSNAKYVCDLCKKNGIKVAGIIKGANGKLSVARDYVDGGCSLIGSSRLEQLERCRKAGFDVPLLMIRIPMISEIEDLVRITDISLNSEPKVLKAINLEALKQKRKHKVILMADLGDLREGFFDQDELVKTAVMVENELDGLELAGVGTNLGCYGSVMPTEDKMLELSDIAERIEKCIDRKLEYVSGGATSSLMGVYDGFMPQKINMLRIGALVIVGAMEDFRLCYGYEQVADMSDEAFVLKAEVVEVKKKPSHPIGKLGVC